MSASSPRSEGPSRPGAGRAFVPLVAWRLMSRSEDTAAPWTWWLAAGSGAVVLVASSMHLLVRPWPWTAVAVVVCAFVALGTVCFRRLVPTLAVTVLGVALGVASLQTVLAVVSGFDRELVEGISAVNGHMAVTKYGLDFYEFNALGEQLRRDPRIVQDSPFAYGTVAVSKGSTEPTASHTDELGSDPVEAGAGAGAGAEDDDEDDDDDGRVDAGLKVVQVKGVLPERADAFPGFRGTLRGGDPMVLSPAQPHERPGAAIGYRLAKDLGIEVGDTVVLVAPHALDGTRESFDARPRSATYDVKDLVDTGVLYIDERTVLTHLTAAQALLFGEGRVTGIEFQLTDRELADEVARDVTRELNEGMHLPPYRAITWRQQGAGLLALLAQVRMILSLVLGLIILVAGSTLVMSLLLLVRRRRHDIAIFAAMGAPTRSTFWVFESIGVFAGLLGAVGGIVTGTLACVMLSTLQFELADGIYPVSSLPVDFRPADALVPAFVSLVACSLVSGPIAMAAARVRTIDGLRL